MLGFVPTRLSFRAYSRVGRLFSHVFRFCSRSDLRGWLINGAGMLEQHFHNQVPFIALRRNPWPGSPKPGTEARATPPG